MKILSVSAQKPHSTGSGVYLSGLVEAFARAGHEQAVVAGVYAEDPVHFPQGVAWYPVVFDTPRLPFALCGMSDEMPYVSTRYRDMTPEMVAQFRAGFVEAVEQAVAEFVPDVIIVHHLYLLAAILREAFPRVPLYGICHGTCLRQLDTNPLCRDEITASVAKLDGFFCQQDTHVARVRERFGVTEDQITLIGSGYNSGVFFREEGECHEGLRIAYAGKIAEKKGVFSLLRALNNVDAPEGMALEVYLAGGFNQRDLSTVQDLIAGCAHPATLLGPLPQTELAKLFNASDVFVLPSYYEGLPLVLAEALACGCKVVCTDLPGVAAWMDDTVPNHGIRFVAPPRMIDADTPLSEDLPAFEERLARAISSALRDAMRQDSLAPDLAGVTWQGVAEKILGAICAS